MTTAKLESIKSGDAYKVTIDSVKGEISLGSAPVITPMPDLAWNASTFGVPVTKIFDIQKITHMIHLDGYVDANSSSRSNSDTMKEVYADLIKMVKYGGTIRFEYGDIYPDESPGEGIITKMMLNEVAEDQTGESPSKWSIKLDITIGSQR